VHAGRLIRKKIRFFGTEVDELNKLIEKWLNKNQVFPDFNDVIKFIEAQNLGYSAERIRELGTSSS